MDDIADTMDFTESPSGMWHPSFNGVFDIPPLDLDAFGPMDSQGMAYGEQQTNNAASASTGQVEGWLQGPNLSGPHADFEPFPTLNAESSTDNRHGRALSTSDIPPEINIDFAPPQRTADRSPVPASAADVQSSPTLFPLDMRRRSSTSSRRMGSRSSSRIRSSSAGSARRDNFILNLADPEVNPEHGPSTRVQKHPATFQCTLCPKRFTRAYNLRSHLRTHTDERPFICTACGKAFARQHDRKRHEGLHSGEKKFVCRGDLQSGCQWGCGRRFARADALGRHFRSEAGRVCIKPLMDEEVQQYGQTSMDWNYLPARLLQQYPGLASIDWTTTAPEPDQYDFVSPPSRTSSFGGSSSFGSNSYAPFGYNHNLSRQTSSTSLQSIGSATSFSSQRGTRILGGYQCNQCGLTFDLPSDLRHHERNHLSKEQRPHACDHCGERFLYPKDVQRHTRRKHGILRTSPLSSPLLNPTADPSLGQGLGLDDFRLDTIQQEVLPPEGFDWGPNRSPKLLPVEQFTQLAEGDLSQWENHNQSTEPAFGPRIGQSLSKTVNSDRRTTTPDHNEAAEQPSQEGSDEPSALPPIPRTKSEEIMKLKMQLHSAKNDARLWREERNFYADLLNERIHCHEKDQLPKYGAEERVTPVRRAKGWLGNIWTMLRAKKKREDDARTKATGDLVAILAAELDELEVRDGGGGNG